MSGTQWQIEQWQSPFNKYNYPATKPRDYNFNRNNYTEYETNKCPICGQRMTRFFREKKMEGGWVRTSGFYQACFNPDCMMQRASVIGEYGSYRYTL